MTERKAKIDKKMDRKDYWDKKIHRSVKRSG